MDKFKLPTPQEKTLKVLVYGLPKTGKSHFVHTATEVGPVLWQDTEHGSDYYDAEVGHGFKVAYDKSPETALEAVGLANSMVKPNEKETRPIVAVDSMSSVWFLQQEVAERLSGGKDRATFRAWGPAKKPLKKLYDAMMLSQCHVVLTARAKKLYVVSGSGEPTEKGIGPDMEKGLEYVADIVLETGVDGKGYFAIVKGSRSPHLNTGDRIDDPKFSDLLVAMQPGKAPEEVVEDIEKQLEEAKPITADQFKKYIEGPGRDLDEARKIWGGKFGAEYVPEDGHEYVKYLKDFYSEGKNED